jgi:cell division protein FtsQ
VSTDERTTEGAAGTDAASDPVPAEPDAAAAPATTTERASPVDADHPSDRVVVVPEAQVAGSPSSAELASPVGTEPAARDEPASPRAAGPWAPPTDPGAPAGPADPAAPARRVRPRRLVAVIAAAALVVAAGLVGATYTSLFAADAIRVHGVHHLTKAEVLRLSGLERGVNVFHLDAAAIEARIERDPWVARATLSTELPGTVIVTIRERVPVAVVNDGTVERLVAGDGGLLGVGAPPNLPRIVAEQGATTTDPAAVRAAAGAVAAMRPDVRRQIAFVRLLPEGDLALELRSGVPVVYGSAEDAAPKAQALAAMLRSVERTGERFTSIDVSVPTAPAGTLVGG